MDEHNNHDDDLNIWPYCLPEGGALDFENCPDCWEKSMHRQRYHFASVCFEGMRILDFGCGVGYGTRMMLTKSEEVIGMDSSRSAIELARARGHAYRFYLPEQMVGGPATWHESFNAITAFEVIEHLENPYEFLDALSVRDLLASVPVIPTVGRNPHHRTDFTMESFRSVLERRRSIQSWFIQVKPFHNTPTYAVYHARLR